MSAEATFAIGVLVGVGAGIILGAGLMLIGTMLDRARNVR